MIQVPPSNELKSRIKSGLIKLNGDPITFDQFKGLNLESGVPLGDFLFDKMSKHKGTFNMARNLGFEVDVWADTNMKSLQEIFAGKAILRLSKKDVYLIDAI